MSRPADGAGAPAPWLEAAQGGWALLLKVQPGARRTEVQGVAEDRLRLRLAAPPVEGKANEALLRWLADRLGLRVRDLAIVSGETSRLKRVRFDSTLSAAEVEQRLLEG